MYRASKKQNNIMLQINTLFKTNYTGKVEFVLKICKLENVWRVGNKAVIYYQMFSGAASTLKTSSVSFHETNILSVHPVLYEMKSVKTLKF